MPKSPGARGKATVRKVAKPRSTTSSASLRRSTVIVRQGKPAPAVRRDGPRTVSLALQGGGAHGAFTWGVLDRLLQDERVVIDGISGTSAGAVNGAVLVYGMLQGGREGARALLRKLWEGVGSGAAGSIFQPSPFDRLVGNVNLDLSPANHAFDLMTRLLAPYQHNPLDCNPLRDVVSGLIDFEHLRRAHPMPLFISTTNVRTGKIRVFGAEELSVDVLMASACLPLLFRAVEIEGETYWDGGFMGNPAMFPLIYNCRADDIVLVEVNPIRIAEVPTNARAIMDRMNTISFNATMMREMRNIAFVTQLLEQHRLTNRSKLRKIHFHMIQAEEAMAAFGASSKFNIDPAFLDRLFRLGRQTAEQWFEDTHERLGQDTTIDMHKLFF